MKTWKQNLKHLTAEQYRTLRTMCKLSKNVYNQSIYNIRQQYFSEGSYLRYEANYPLMKNEENYKVLGAAVAQQTMKCADNAFKAFFGLLKLAKSGKYASWQINMPKYLQKDSMYKICFTQPYLSCGQFLVPMSFDMQKIGFERIHIKIPPYLQDKKIRQIHIIPKHNGKYFEAVYMFDDKDRAKPALDSEKALSIDFGVNNLATCVTNTGESFIIDGKKLKSINQWYNKELARLSSIKDKQKIKGCTNKQYAITNKRKNRVSNYIYNAAKLIIQYCIDNKIGNIVVGYNEGFQDRANLGRVNNQNFVQIPLGKLKSRLGYLSDLNGINFMLQEESYTSKASFFDNDDIPVWNPQNPVIAEFSGTRIHRGLYKTKSGTLVNADINGALNILRKRNVVSLTALYSSGEVNTPLRIRVL